MARRGAYAKGIVKREQILETALEVIAREGYSGASIRQLADAVGLSQAGLLHYFGSKDELFIAVLRKRDEVDAQRFIIESGLEGFDGLLALIGHNAEVPGLVQLYVHVSAAATDPAHAGHAFFRDRMTLITAAYAALAIEEQRRDRLSPGIDPARFARLLAAAIDGMQTRWLMDPTVDMVADLAAILAVLGVRTGASDCDLPDADLVDTSAD